MSRQILATTYVAIVKRSEDITSSISKTEIFSLFPELQRAYSDRLCFRGSKTDDSALISCDEKSGRYVSVSEKLLIFLMRPK